MKEIGVIRQIFRYPVKSMAGIALEAADLGWHGLEGDRRFALQRLADQSGFPFLTAGRLPELLLYRPLVEDGIRASLPTRVLTPDGRELELMGEDLRAELTRKHGKEVQMIKLKHGIFDEAAVSLIAMSTIREIERESGRQLDVRRFRPNVIVETASDEAFEENDWVGKTLSFGTEPDSPGLKIMMRDERCVMINLDPDTAAADPVVMKAAVRLNTNCAGVYATVIRPGELSIGQKVYLAHAETANA